VASRGRRREALRNGDVVACTLSYLLAVIAMWSVFLPSRAGGAGAESGCAPHGHGHIT
jgi:hypothetical protein